MYLSRTSRTIGLVITISFFGSELLYLSTVDMDCKEKRSNVLDREEQFLLKETYIPLPKVLRETEREVIIGLALVQSHWDK